MNRGFWPIANQGRGLENLAQTARTLAFPVTAEWSPALFGTGTAGVANSGTAASNTVCISGVMVYPSAQIPISYDTNENNRDHALVVALPTTESAFVVSPVRSKLPGFQNMLPLGEPRGKASVCIAPQRNDPANVASGAYSVAIGQNTRSAGSASVALGSAASVAGANSIALGGSSSCPGSSSAAVGVSANCIGSTAAAVGAYSVAQSSNTVAIGSFAAAIGASAVAIGASANANTGTAIAVGPSSIANQAGSIAIGNGAQAQNPNGYALGNTARAWWRASAGFGFGLVDHSFSLVEHYATTTNATVTNLVANAVANSILTFATNNSAAWRVQVIAREAATNETAGWVFEGFARRNAGNIELLSSVTVTSFATSGATAWAASVVADIGLQGLAVQVTGEAAKTIKWLAYWQVTRVQ